MHPSEAALATLPHYLHPSLPMERSEVTLSHILPYLAISWHILSYLVTSCHILSYLVISCIIWSYLVISCHILSYLVISCHTFPYLVIYWHHLKFLANSLFREAILAKKVKNLSTFVNGTHCKVTMVLLGFKSNLCPLTGAGPVQEPLPVSWILSFRCHSFDKFGFGKTKIIFCYVLH